MIEELRSVFGSSVTTAELGAYNQEYMQRAYKGELKRLSRGVWDLNGGGKKGEPLLVFAAPKPDAEQIRHRFKTMNILGKGVVDGNIRSLIVAGGPGIGKTYELEEQLRRAEDAGEITSYVQLKGSISAIGLYETLYNNCEEGQVILLDDIDAVFDNEEALNLLKAALDTSVVRRLSWAKASRFLEENDIPRTFEYRGQIIFITNLDPDKIIAKGGRLAPHMNALVNRSVFLDLCIHSNEAILIRVRQVLEESSLRDDLDLDDIQVHEIVTWLEENVSRLRSLSIRTVIQLAGFVKTTDDWRSLANVTLLRPN